ncbi:MAG TPA: uracil-DNA glycosylase family protein [Kofleriaceae bacterium]|nr:uracil-DNA glycosylase family protein [Kofleriaceae bacterium]
MSTPALVQLKRHIARLRSCHDCPEMIGPVVTGQPVVSPVMLIGQAPGVREGPAGKPFAWTAGRTMFGWFGSLGAASLSEEDFRQRVYMAAVCRCFPGKAKGGGDRVPSPDEIKRCSRHLAREIELLRPRLVIPVGKLAIGQVLPGTGQLADVIGAPRRGELAGVAFDIIALPHPSGASTWHRMEPGKTLLARALREIAGHEAWQSLVAAPPQPTPSSRAAQVSS